MTFNRLVNLSKSYSYFLFGARSTGKSFLLHDEYMVNTDTSILWIDLLERDVEDRYARDPDLLYREAENKQGKLDWIIIDEVQKIPKILDTVHRILETKSFRPPLFALTGSSARKLKHGGANLLAGRAFVNHLFPLTYFELAEYFDLDFVLNFGSLPKIFQLSLDEERNNFLRSYALTYLNEEIWAEHLVQKLDPFRKFLEVASSTSGQIVNYANVARDVGADEKTVKRYYQILEDTLLGFFLEAHSRSVRKRQCLSPKFYFFDTGVTRALSRTLTQKIIKGTYAYGICFEQFYILELFKLNHYCQADYAFSYLMTGGNVEIDLIIDRPGRPTLLVEIKSSDRTTIKDAKNLLTIYKDLPTSCECYVVSNDPHAYDHSGIKFIPWQKSFEEFGLNPQV